jgi:Activator of Hsp90 ATPase homolog 1-like protein
VIEVVEEINRVERRVGSRTFDAGEARTIVIARTYDAALEDVWDACTNPERLPRWFLPVSGELRPGGRYELEGNAGGEIEAATRRTALPRHGNSVETRPGSSSGSWT